MEIAVKHNTLAITWMRRHHYIIQAIMKLYILIGSAMASRTGTTFATLFTLIYMCKIPRALSELNGDNYF